MSEVYRQNIISLYLSYASLGIVGGSINDEISRLHIIFQKLLGNFKLLHLGNVSIISDGEKY